MRTDNIKHHGLAWYQKGKNQLFFVIVSAARLAEKLYDGTKLIRSAKGVKAKSPAAIVVA